MDSPEEEAFDRLTRLASHLLGTRVALISLVDDERQFFKSAVGLSGAPAEERGTPLSHSYCKHVVDSGKPLVVEDAREHPLLQDNPAIVDHDAISYCGVPIKDKEGQVLGTLCVVDEEVRSWSAQEVQVLGDLAQSVIAEMRLRLLSTELEDKNAALHDLVAVASHDIRSPLAIILNYARMLAEADEFGLTEAEKSEFLGTVKDEAQRASRLVSDLLDVTKLETGVEQPRTEEVALGPIIEKEADRTSAEGARVAVVTEEALTALVDPDDFRRIISSLLENASKYGRPPIRVEGWSTGTTARICVSDEGDGVPKDFAPRLFEKFARSEKTSGVRGSGLGLAIASGLAERNRGRLDFEANEPRGSRFTLELPLT